MLHAINSLCAAFKIRAVYPVAKLKCLFTWGIWCTTYLPFLTLSWPQPSEMRSSTSVATTQKGFRLLLCLLKISTYEHGCRRRGRWYDSEARISSPVKQDLVDSAAILLVGLLVFIAISWWMWKSYLLWSKTVCNFAQSAEADCAPQHD